MAPTAFGSSFLVGPVEVEGRPIVKLREVVFEPNSRTLPSSTALKSRRAVPERANGVRHPAMTATLRSGMEG